MKNYLKALLEYEETNNSLDLLYNFFAFKKSDLINSYCEGEINLPSFILLKRLKEKYSVLTKNDKELDYLFESAIKCSKIFYVRTLKIIVIKDIKFENLFIQQIQPIGQQLINLLINIKFRIRLVRLKQASQKPRGMLRILEKIAIIIKPLRTMFSSILYKLSLFQAANHKYIPFIYITTLLFMTPILLLVEHYFINDLSLETSYLNVIFCLSVLISAILAYPMKRFGKMDIYGRDIVAYKYRVFFNNTLNKKMYQVFALEHSNISRQQISQSIDSQ
jgi:hypothetical protein